MLLRRVTQHVRDQNWFAVFIDFLIVVVGILIAFQITEWNEARITAGKQQEVEARLINDFQLIDKSLDEALALTSTIIRNTDTLKQSIDRVQAHPEDDAAIKHALVRMRTYPDLIRFSSTYNELKSSGSLGLIRSQELRNALALYHEQAGNRLLNLEQIRNSMQQVFINAAQYAVYAPLDPENIKIRPIHSYDIEGMSKDIDFQQRLDYTLTLQTFIHLTLTDQRNEADRVLQALELK